MCYFLFGSINERAYNKSFFQLCEKHGIPYEKHTSSDGLAEPDHIEGVVFRLTDYYCDCNGFQDEGDLANYLNWLQELRNCKNGKHISITRQWATRSRRKKPSVPIKVISIDAVSKQFLLNMDEEVVYKIKLF